MSQQKRPRYGWARSNGAKMYSKRKFNRWRSSRNAMAFNSRKINRRSR